MDKHIPTNISSEYCHILTATTKCGCKLRLVSDGVGLSISYCPTHAAALEMKNLLVLASMTLSRQAQTMDVHRLIKRISELNIQTERKSSSEYPEGKKEEGV